MNNESKHTTVETAFAAVILLCAVGLFVWEGFDKVAAKMSAPFSLVVFLFGVMVTWNARIAHRLRKLESTINQGGSQRE